jgi:hypothetical protein
MRTGPMRDPGGRPALDQPETFENQLRWVRQDAKANWTPGQALGEILSYLDRVEYFTASSLTASFVRRRMRWLTAVLAAAVQRAQVIGLDPRLLGGVFSALGEHDALLRAERTVAGVSAKAARDMIRLEVAYMRVEQQER